MFLATIIFMLQMDASHIQTRTVHPPVSFASFDECLTLSNLAANDTIAERPENIVGYAVICERADEV